MKPFDPALIDHARERFVAERYAELSREHGPVGVYGEDYHERLRQAERDYEREVENAEAEKLAC